MPLTPDFNVARDLEKVRALVARLGNPHWMQRPRDWVWARPDGRPQGFGPIAYTDPGLANLLWLSMDFDVPPQTYDAGSNGLYVLLLNEAASARVDGMPLADLAGLCTLREFSERLMTVPEPAGAERAYPLLKLLALRRLHYVGL